MFEHVGVDFYETFFRRCAELLTDDGVMLLHAIGRSDGPDVTVVPMTRDHIVPAEAKLRALESRRKPWLKMAGG